MAEINLVLQDRQNIAGRPRELGCLGLGRSVAQFNVSFITARRKKKAHIIFKKITFRN